MRAENESRTNKSYMNIMLQKNEVENKEAT